MYVIATDSRFKNEVLFMVDRNRQRASFWSNRLDDAMKYGDKSSAQQKATKLRFNQPRVLTLQAAAQIAGEQMKGQEHEAALYADEAGWDGHKGHF
jgi:inhibitor of KinA sporulation pathway (predicted exonuclease)